MGLFKNYEGAAPQLWGTLAPHPQNIFSKFFNSVVRLVCLRIVLKFGSNPFSYNGGTNF